MNFETIVAVLIIAAAMFFGSREITARLDAIDKRVTVIESRDHAPAPVTLSSW